MSSPPSSAAAVNISAWMWQARSHVGWRLAVASRPNSNRPGPPPLRGAGTAASLARNSATFWPAVFADLSVGSLSRDDAMVVPPHLGKLEPRGGGVRPTLRVGSEAPSLPKNWGEWPVLSSFSRGPGLLR